MKKYKSNHSLFPATKPNGKGFSMVNGALHGFVTGASIELSRGIRINVGSPGVVEDAEELFPFFPGHNPVSME